MLGDGVQSSKIACKRDWCLIADKRPYVDIFWDFQPLVTIGGVMAVALSHTADGTEAHLEE